MPNFTPLLNTTASAHRYRPLLRSAVLCSVLTLGTFLSQVWANTIHVPADYATISAAITAASAGDIIMVAPGTYTLSSSIVLNKDVTIDGGDKTTTFIQGNIGLGSNFILISGAGAGATIRNLSFHKTDKTGVQEIIALQANNVTVENCNFTGQYILGDPDVSRGFVVSVGITGLLIQNCSFSNLRQPAYLNPGVVGQILNNNVDQTRGWVVDRANVTFNGNTFGTNAVDIALLDGTRLGPPYDPLTTLAANNDGAVFSNQRTAKAYNLTQETSHASIQAANNAANNGDWIWLADVVHNEDVVINKDITVQGSGMNYCTVSGPIGGASNITFSITASGVTLDGMTITRDGNNPTDWTNSGINSPGIAIQGQAITNTEIKNCKITGNRTGIDVNNSNGHNIHNNIITKNRTGLIFRNQTDNITLTENEITDNYTVGIVFLDGSVGTNNPVQTALNSNFNNNKITGNWYGQVVDRQSGGSLPPPGTNLKNFDCNWYGSASPVASTANSTEPGGNSPFPTYYGGPDVPPTPGPEILGPASANIDYLLYLVNGTDNAPATTGFQPVPLSCIGGCPGGGYVINENSSGIFCSIQDAINAATSGNRLKVATGTYAENVNAATPSKNITFAPGNSPGCVTINGNLTLNGGDVLEMEIEGTTPCTQHDQLIVNGTVTLGGATLTLPMGMYLASDGDQIVLIDNDGTDPVVGTFAQGNFVTDGPNSYYINYAGGSGNDVVLTNCCGAIIDIGIFTATVAPVDNPGMMPDILAGHKLTVKARPNVDAVYGAYSSGKFTIRTLSSNNVGNFTGDNVHSEFGYVQDGAKQTNSGYDYFVFRFDALPDPLDLDDWTAGSEHDLLTLTYSCSVGNAVFELTNDAFAQSIGGQFYQELNGESIPGAQGIFYAPNATVTGPGVLAITATSNSPVCQTMEIDLNSSASGGSPTLTYAWSGPDTYTSTLGNPVPFTALLTSAGAYTVTVTDGNGCTATSSTNVVVPATGACVKNENTILYYPTINQAINAAPTMNGHTLTVPAGTWAEDVIVNKSLTINGPNAAIDACTGTRVAEAIVVPATNAVGSGEIFHVTASNVSIKGFTIDGDNPALTSGVTNPSGSDLNAREGVTVYVDNVNNLTVSNNIFQNLSYFGVTLFGASYSAPATTGHTISNNKFQHLGTYNDPAPPATNINFWGGGVLLYNNQYAAVTSNCMTDVRIGIQTGNYAQANPGSAAYQVINGNTMSVRRRGIFHNLHYSAASGYTLSNNSITGVANVNETAAWDGILLSSLSVPSFAQSNSVNGAAISIPSVGYAVWNVKNTSPTDISGGSVSNVGTGLFVNNYDSYPTTGSNAVDGAHATVSGLSISPLAAGTGIRLRDNSLSTHANVQLGIGAGVTITGGSRGLVIENASASIVGATLNNLAFSGQTVNYIELVNNGGDLNGTAATFDGLTGNTATLAQNFDIEDKIIHKLDNGALGFVLVKANHDFVTPNSAKIQRGVNAASSGFTVHVKAGSYTENVTVDKSLTILGPNDAINPCSPGRVAEAIVLPAAIALESTPSTSGAIFRLGTLSGHINVTIKGFTIDGSNPALGAGRTLNGVDVHTGAGIVNSIGSFDANPGAYDVTMIVQNNIIQNLERYGVLVDNTAARPAVTGSDVSYNKIDNLPSGNVYGGGRGRGIAFEENHYGSATYNCITRVNVGWQDDNYNLPSPGAATVVSNNTISSYHRGIFHNLCYQSASNATISNNTISAESSNNSGTDFGIEIASMQTAVGATVSNNNVTGKKYGILLWNCPTTATIHVTGGTLTGNTHGVYATNNDPQFGAASNSTYVIDGVSIQGSITNGIWVEDNQTATVGVEITNITINGSTAAAGILVSGADASAYIHDNAATITGTLIGVDIDGGTVSNLYRSKIHQNGTGVRVKNGGNLTSTTENFITNSTGDGISVEASAGAIGPINDNDLSGNVGKAIKNLTANLIAATCNWYGTVGSGAIAAKIQGPVTYSPYRTGNTDAGGPTNGFQPTDPCAVITDLFVDDNSNTGDIYTPAGTGSDGNPGTAALPYRSVQLAVNSASDGDVIYVDAGNFPENIFVTKAVIVKGTNFGIPCTGTRVAESIITGGAGTAVTLSSNGVTLDGFQIEGSTGVSSTGFTKEVIKNNKVNALAVGINSALLVTSATDIYTVQDNCVDLSAQAYETFPFSVNPTLAATQTAGAWYTDRYAPNGFVAANFGGNSRLKHSINATDTQGDAFYNTQGRKYDIAGTTAMSIQLYIPAGWAATNRRMAGFWGTAVNGSNATTGYPIIEFTSDGGNPRFRGWDDNLGWIDMGLPTGFAYDQWYTLNTALIGGNYVYNVGSLQLTVPAGAGGVSIANVILQGYNHAPGLTYDIYWDNLNTFGSPAATENSPTAGIALTAASGTKGVTLKDNNVSDAFYGYVLAGVTTSPRTSVRGGTYTNLMQGIVATNTLDGVTYLPSTVGVDTVGLTSFSGNHPNMPAANFHAGVYVFTGGSNTGAVVDITVDSVTVSNTGKISADCAGLYFADFSTGAGNRLNAVVSQSHITSNKNRGIQVRGANATALVNTSAVLFNGADPYGTGGNNGFGIYAGVGAALTLQNNFVTNPPSQVGAFPVTAMFIGVAPGATINATENKVNRNGNGSLTANTIGTFNATCNWWGSSAIDVVDGLVDGNVTFIPYLNNGTDNSTDRGFQPVALSCVSPKHWFVNDNALGGDVYTLAVGNDLNQGTKRRPFLTIGKAITTVVSSDTIYVDAGTYNEQSVVPSSKNNLLFKGAGLSTIVNFTGTAVGKPTLFDIAGNGVVIDSFQFNVNLTNLSSAIIASHAALDNITVKNNKINPYQSLAGTNFGSYGDRNAISINYGGTTNYRVASGGVNSIIVDKNIVTATVNPPFLGGPDPLDVAFRAAVAVDEGAGTYTRNTFQTINHDILVRFNSNGPVVIGGSVANANTFNGGGVTYADPNASGGAVTISHNTFDGSVSNSVMRLQNNYNSAATTVSNNTFNNLRWGISLENYPAATVSNNVFTPLAGYTTFRHITVNTKSLSSNSPLIVQVPINGVFTGNTFNSLSPTTGGTAMAFYNHDSDNETLGTFTVGTAVSPNVFAKDFTFAVYLGDQTGPTLPAPVAFPEYGDIGASSSTIMACWDKDIDIRANTFDVGSGAQLPPSMNHAQRVSLEAILWHKLDNPCLGELIYFVPVEVIAKVFLQGPYDSSSGLMNEGLRTPVKLIPLASPYDTMPYAFTVVNNFVTETINTSVLDVSGNNAIVDWVWLELRSKTNSDLVLATRSALLQRDGDIVDLDGSSEVLFPDTYVDEYFLMVRHRNHLAAMTAAKVDFTNLSTVVDFTTAAQATFGTTTTSARRLVKTGIYGLWAGNTIPKANSDYRILYNGSSNDRAAILNAVGSATPLNILSGVYKLEDVNMNGNVQYSGSGNDRVIILNNVGASTPLNTILQQPNN